MFDNATMKLHVEPLILSALKEDITSEDISANSIIAHDAQGTAKLLCKQDGVICGLQVFEKVFKLLNERTRIEYYTCDGEWVKYGQVLGTIKGDIRTILAGERTALNFLQRMSGVSTATAKAVKMLEGTDIKVVDTRKTTPNNRIFEKYAVRCGGGCNHRLNLSDGILLKDNHIGAAGSIEKAIKLAKEYASFVRKIEVEVESIEMARQAVEAGADIIMLDNMSVQDMAKAVEIIKGRAQIEVSGNITPENISAIRKLKVDFVSSGALTHSSQILDLSLKNLKAI